MSVIFLITYFATVLFVPVVIIGVLLGAIFEIIEIVSSRAAKA